MNRIYKINNLLIKVGNKKIGDDTIILNMGTAEKCPSLLLGCCKAKGDCYALQAEKFYKGPIIKYRERQAEYWLNTDSKDIIKDFDILLTEKKSRNEKPGKMEILAKKIKYFRYNESGDFYNKDCISKLDKISKHLKKQYKIVTYGYSARKDLDFSNVSFLCKSSGWNNGNNGQTMILNPGDIMPKGFIQCPRNCLPCHLCKSSKGFNIAFRIHGKGKHQTWEKFDKQRGGENNEKIDTSKKRYACKKNVKKSQTTLRNYLILPIN
jgi:hypothetical protein